MDIVDGYGGDDCDERVMSKYTMRLSIMIGWSWIARRRALQVLIRSNSWTIWDAGARSQEMGGKKCHYGLMCLKLHG